MRGRDLGGLAIATLKGVGFAVFALWILFVAVFDEDDLAELAKGGDGAAPATFPKCLVALADSRAQFLARNGGKVFAGLVFVEAPFGRFAIAHGDVGHDVLVALARRKFVEAQKAAGEAGDSAAVVRAKTGPVAAGLFYGLGKFGIAHIGPLTLEHEPRGF